MAKIVRYDGNLQAFASAAVGTERTLFGEVTQANDLTSQITADFLRGWGIVGPSDQPALEDFNAVGYTLSQLLAYLHQMGVAEYNATQEYHIGSIVQTGGALYISLQNTNVGNAPASSPLFWSSRISDQTVGIQGAFKNMASSCTGSSSTITFTADEITLKNASNAYYTARSVSLSANTGAASGAANSLDTGAWAQSTWYAQHVIYNPTTSTLALLWSLSRTAPALPSGYTFWAYTGQSYRTQPATNFNPLAMQWTGHRGSYIKGSVGNITFLPVMAIGNQGSPSTPTYASIAWADFAPPDTYEIDLVARVGTATAQVACAPNNTYGRPGDANQLAPTIAHVVGNNTSALSIRQSFPVEGANVYYASDDATYSLLQCCGFTTKG